MGRDKTQRFELLQPRGNLILKASTHASADYREMRVAVDQTEHATMEKG
jgi:hypothetical protein